MIDETGGPAFPLDRDCCNVGMTLRDYFAAKAMHGYLSDYEWHSEVSLQDTAVAAYRMADEMLKARTK
jgi:hypothetical protein